MSEENKSADIDGDGVVSDKEKNLIIEKIRDQGRMAWISFILIIAAGIYTLVYAPDERVTILGNGVMDWFYIILGSLILAYFGVTTFISKK